MKIIFCVATCSISLALSLINSTSVELSDIMKFSTSSSFVKRSVCADNVDIVFGIDPTTHELRRVGPQPHKESSCRDERQHFSYFHLRTPLI